MSHFIDSTLNYRSVLTDHEMVVEGKIFHETKKLENTTNEDGNKVGLLCHMKAIGERKYTSNQKFIDGEAQEETIETEMSQEEIEEFKKEWIEKWHPSIVEKSSGIMANFFKKLNDLFDYFTNFIN